MCVCDFYLGGGGVCVCVTFFFLFFFSVRKREREQLARFCHSDCSFPRSIFFFPRFKSKNVKRNKVVDPSSSLQPTDSPL